MSERQLFMRLPSLADLPPAVALPTGFQLRAACLKDGRDREQLAEVLSQAFGDTWDAVRVGEVLSPEEGVQEIYTVVAGASVVATASARLVPDLYPASGYVHFVGAHPQQRGRRLGEAVTRAVLEYFARIGMHDAVLETDDFREPAIKLYLRLGFVPEYRAGGDQLRWSRVLRRVLLTTSAPSMARSPGGGGSAVPVRDLWRYAQGEGL